MTSNSLTASMRETLAVFEDGTPLSTSEVASALDLGRRSTYDRLDRLAERGRLETKKVGAKARVWWKPPVEPAAESDSQTPPARRERHEEFESLVEAVDEYAIFTLGPEGRVRTWNPGAERIKGYEADEITGEHFGVFYTEGDRADGVPADNLAAAADQGAIEDEGWRVRADGSRFWANVTITAIRDEGGDLTGYAKVTRDMTQRRAQEERLRNEREVVEQVLETSPVGLGMFSRTGLEEANARLAEVYGDRAEELGEEGGDGPAIYDGDGEPVAPDERPTARVFDTGESIDAWECQVEASDGSRRWLSVSAAPIEGKDGEVERVVVAAEDVTRLKEQAQVLERERDELEAELDEVFARIDDAFYALDEDFRFTYVNEQAETLLDRSQGELLGRSVWEVFPEATETPALSSLRRALDTQEPTSFETYFEPREFWVEANVYPSRTGLSVYFRDVTGRKERERELERYETLFEESKDVNVVLDVEGNIQYVTPSVSSVFGYDQEELVGERGFEYIHPDDKGEAMDAFAEMVENPEYEPRIEFRFRHGDGSWVTIEVLARNLLDDRDIQGIVVYSRDVTERKEREHELERYETLVETVSDGVYVVDDTGHFRVVNDAYAEMVGLSRGKLLGAHVTDVVDEETAARAQTVQSELRSGARDRARLETEIERADGEAITAEATFALISGAGEEAVERVAVVRDVTERRRRERELEESRRRYRTLVEHFPNGAVALVDTDLRYRTVGGTPIDGSGASADDLEGSPIEEVLPTEMADVFVPRYEAALAGEPSTFEYEASDGSYEVRLHPVRDDDGEVFAAMGMSQDVTERNERERALRRQREQLAALNNLNEVVREITGAVIEQSTRPEIEQTVCEHLAASDSYAFAWIGTENAASGAVTARAAAGGEGDLEDQPASIESDGGRPEGPAREALRTGSVQVTDDVLADDARDAWRDRFDADEVRSAAAIPIGHENTVYGVLNVYSERPGAFADRERAVIGQLGEIVGHAIAAAERKRALLADEVVEVEFRLPGVFEAVGVDEAGGGTIRLEEFVPIGDGEFVVYGTASTDAVADLEAIVDGLDHWTDLTVREGANRANVEIQLSEPPVLSTIASLGGSIEEAVIEDGVYRMTVHLAPNADVGQLVDVVEEAYPVAEMVAHRQVERDGDATRQIYRVLDEALTERQEATLRAAYHAGFFEWPRDVDGETVAESLSISPPTFSQHLRKAEKKALDALLSS